MSAIRFATQNILSRLNTKELSVETRCNCSPPFHINILPEDSAPARRQISGSFQQILLAATFMKRTESRKCQMVRHRRQC